MNEVKLSTFVELSKFKKSIAPMLVTMMECDIESFAAFAAALCNAEKQFKAAEKKHITEYNLDRQRAGGVFNYIEQSTLPEGEVFGLTYGWAAGTVEAREWLTNDDLARWIKEHHWHNLRDLCIAPMSKLEVYKVSTKQVSGL